MLSLHTRMQAIIKSKSLSIKSFSGESEARGSNCARIRRRPETGGHPASRSHAARAPRASRTVCCWGGSALCSAAVAGRDALPHLRYRAQLALGEARAEVLAHDPDLRAAGFLQALAAGVGQARIGPARVVVAGASVKQPVALEPVDEPRQAAARKLRV